MNGERSRLGCCSARPRAEHRRERTHYTVNRFACAEWPARARPTAPEAGARSSRLLRISGLAVERLPGEPAGTVMWGWLAGFQGAEVRGTAREIFVDSGDHK